MNPLKLLTLNLAMMEIDFPILRRISLVKNKNIRIAAVIQEFKNSDYDVLLLQEIGGSLLKKMVRELSVLFPYHATHHTHRLFSRHLLILSKIPLEDINFIPFTHQDPLEGLVIQKGLLCTTVNWNNNNYHLINTHLIATVAGINDSSKTTLHIREKQIQQMSHYIHNREHPDEIIIVCGDFNCGPTYCSEGYTLLGEKLYDCMKQLPESERITWSVENPMIQNVSKNDPDKQTDGFYMTFRQYEQLKSIITLSRVFVDEVEATLDNAKQKTMLSDHYGVELLVKKTL
jgi:endonuclease/exonuclease/phosphatase family metal-dependent hydrolase